MAATARVPKRNTQLLEAAQKRLTGKLVSFFTERAPHVSRQIYERIQRETLGKSSTVAKVKRDAFLYLDPRGDADKFAQCGTCKEFLSDGSCYLFGSQVSADASCGLYVPGPADPAWKANGQLVTPAEAGYVDRQVRCENCRFFENGECGLFDTLNDALPDVFDLATAVEAKGCCNAQTPLDNVPDNARKSSDHSGLADLHVKPENAVAIHLPQPVADVVTRANIQHISWEMVREGKTGTERVRLPLAAIIPTQQVVDRERVAKHEEELRTGEGLEPGQPAPLVILWDGDNFLLGGHHGLQAAHNLGFADADFDRMVAPGH